MRITIKPKKQALHLLPILLTLLLLSIPSSQKQVDSFNLLFPTSYKHSIPPTTGCYARQIVTTSGGCYNWQSTEPAVVRVVGTHHGLVPSQSAVRDSTCLTNGVIELVHADRYGSSVYVTARDRDDGDIITIPVRIRDLKRIAIFTKSKIMNIKEVQNLQIYGFDAESNTFTSLEGLRFKWTITQIEEGKNSIGSVEKIPLKDSSLYMALDTRKKLENQEKVQSDWLVVKALRVGKVLVKVRCLQPNYQMLTDQITLFIQQKFQLSPSLQVHVLPGSTFSYKLLTPTGFQISLPHPHYKISFSNPDFSYKIEGNQLLVTCPRTVSSSSVSTSLTVSDTRTEPPFSQSVDIVVDQPDQLEIVMPGQIVIGGEGKYQVRFKRNGKHIKGNIDPIYLNVKVIEDTNRNTQGGNVFMVDRVGGKIRATNKGSGILRVQYNGITAQKKLSSTTPLKLLSPTPKILLPVSQIYQLTIIGGSGSYRYTFSQTSSADVPQQILSLSSTGLITTRRQGNTVITVIDEKNKDNRIDVRVEVKRIGQLFSLEEIREFNLDQQGSLYIGARPNKQGVASQQIYTQCNDALLRGLSLTPFPSSIPPLKILSTNPISYQTLRELLSLSQQNPQIQSQIQSHSSLPISTAQLMKIYEPYVRYGEIKESQLERIIIDMEDYGLCAKVMVKAGNIFDGQIGIEKAGYGDGVGSDRFKLRVYDRMVNNIKGYEIKTHNGKDQIVLAPQASFKWVIQGGPYSWQAIGQPPLEVSINKIKLDSQRSPQSHLFPTITCPSSSSSTNTYTLKYRNPQTIKLLRPVEQEKQIIVHCRPVERLLIGLPIKKKVDSSVHQHSLGGFSAENRDRLDKDKDRYTGQLYYFVSDQKNSTVYINPDNCFRISVQPILRTQSIPSLQYTNAQKASDSQVYLPFYNASNVQYEIIGSRNGKIQKIGHVNPNSNTPKDWNTYLITYDSKSRSKSSQQSDDYITISIKNPISKNPLTHTILIKTLKPLKLASAAPAIIDLPSHSLSSFTLKMSPVQVQGQNSAGAYSQFYHKRYSVLCDENLVKCKKLANGDIVVTPVQGASGKSYVRIVDQYTIGNPEIQLPIRIVPISGLNLKLARYDNSQSVSLPLSQKQVNAWIFEGQQFLAYVDVYTLNSTLKEMGKQPKQVILGVDPEIIQLNFQKGSVERSPIFKQVSRSSDKNGLIVIRYCIIGRIFDKKQQQTQNKKYSQKITATLRQPSTSTGSSYAKNPIISNTAALNIYNQISLSGTKQIMPVEQLSININDKNRDNIGIQRKFDSYIHILESCETVVEINGGPSQLKSRIISNSGQSKFYNVHKLSQRSYKIQSIQSTPSSSSSSSPSGSPSVPQPITGRQKNLLVLQVYIDSPKSSSRSHQIQLATIRSVIFIQPIKNIHISGLSQMLVDKESRYLVEFGEEGWDSKEQSWRDYQCSLKYKWDIVGNTGNILQITSDPTKMSINISTTPTLTPQLPLTPQLSVTIYNKFSRQIGRQQKPITIISQTPIPNTALPTLPITTNNQLLLMPSNSEYSFPEGITVEQIVPCEGVDNGITVKGAGQLSTGDATRYPQLVRMYQNRGSDSLLPVYVAVQVVDICAVVIQNYDGSITINPSSSSSDNVQLIKFYLLDCLSRKLLPAKYSKISYRVSITHSSTNPDPSLSSSSPSTSSSNIIASASLYSAQQNLIALKGHEIGSARLVLQVMHNNVLKARDVLPVYVNVFMRPAKPFTTSIGNTISFKGPASQSTRYSQKRWSSSNPQVLKIDPQTGEAIALNQGEVNVKYGTMSTKVGVIKIVDIVKVDQDKLSQIGNGAVGGKQGKRRGNGYLYQLVYSGKKVGGDGEDAQYIRSNLAWTCQILTKQSKSFRCHIYPFTHNSHTYLSAQIQKIPHTQTVSTPISNLQLKIGCSCPSPSGFSFSKSVSQTPQFFILLSEHYVSLRDPSLSNRQNYQIVVQTNQRLRYRQVGGKEGWLLGSQFNGVKQVISVDLTHLRNDWKVEIQNQRTGQRDTINFGFARVEERETSNSRIDAVDDKDGWKWTDILVIFMAVNFLILIVYQIYQSNSSEHIKSY